MGNSEIFDANTRAQIEELLGKESYAERLSELILEIDGTIDAMAGEPLEAQISMVHKISGVSAMLGLIGLHEDLLAAELRGKAGDADGFDADWRSFLAKWPARKGQIEAVINA